MSDNEQIKVMNDYMVNHYDGKRCENTKRDD